MREREREREEDAMQLRKEREALKCLTLGSKSYVARECESGGSRHHKS